MHKAFFALLLGISVIRFPAAAMDDSVYTITTVTPQKALEASHDYYFSILKQATTRFSGFPETINIIQKPLSNQGRTLKLLGEGGVYDVAWAGETEERNNQLLKVDVPLMLGGLGWRGMVVRESDKQMISDFRSVADFSKLIACQGMGWPDADILEHAGFRVIRIAQFDNMYDLLTKGRCDFLPLSIYEGQAELEAVSSHYPGLEFIYQPIIRYRLNMYFYVTPSKPELAEALYQAMKELEESGELEAFARRHRLTRNAFPLTRYKHFIDI